MYSRPAQACPRALGRIHVRYGVEKLERSAFTLNVSMSGAFLRTNRVHPPGTALRVELTLGERKVALTARVMWAKQVPPQMAQVLTCGMGVRFVEAGPEWREFFGVWAAQRGIPCVAKPERK